MSVLPIKSVVCFCCSVYMTAFPNSVTKSHCQVTAVKTTVHKPSTVRVLASNSLCSEHDDTASSDIVVLKDISLLLLIFALKWFFTDIFHNGSSPRSSIVFYRTSTMSCPTVKLYCRSWNCDILYVLVFLTVLLNEMISTPDLPADLASVALTEQ